MTHPEELLQSRVLHIRSTIAKDHLGGQREGVPADVAEKIIGAIQQAGQKKLVLEILIGKVGDGSLDVEDIMNHLADHSPGIAVFLVPIWLIEAALLSLLDI